MASRYPRLGKQIWTSEEELEKVLRARIIRHFANHKGRILESYLVRHICYSAYGGYVTVAQRVINDLIFEGRLERSGTNLEFLERR